MQRECTWKLICIYLVFILIVYSCPYISLSRATHDLYSLLADLLHGDMITPPLRTIRITSCSVEVCRSVPAVHSVQYRALYTVHILRYTVYSSHSAVHCIYYTQYKIIHSLVHVVQIH